MNEFAREIFLEIFSNTISKAQKFVPFTNASQSMLRTREQSIAINHRMISSKEQWRQRTNNASWHRNCSSPDITAKISRFRLSASRISKWYLIWSNDLLRSFKARNWKFHKFSPFFDIKTDSELTTVLVIFCLFLPLCSFSAKIDKQDSQTARNVPAPISHKPSQIVWVSFFNFCSSSSLAFWLPYHEPIKIIFMSSGGFVNVIQLSPWKTIH